LSQSSFSNDKNMVFPIGMIIGCTIGGLSLITCLAVTGICFWKRHKNKEEMKLSSDNACSEDTESLSTLSGLTTSRKSFHSFFTSSRTDTVSETSENSRLLNQPDPIVEQRNAYIKSIRNNVNALVYDRQILETTRKTLQQNILRDLQSYNESLVNDLAKIQDTTQEHSDIIKSWQNSSSELARILKPYERAALAKNATSNAKKFSLLEGLLGIVGMTPNVERGDLPEELLEAIGTFFQNQQELIDLTNKDSVKKEGDNTIN